jgi:hypothetical protein
MVRAVRGVLAVTCAGALTAACSGGPGRLDTRRVERFIAKQLRKDFVGAKVGPVHCPRKVTKKPGRRFGCTAMVAGAAVAISVTQTSGKLGFRTIRNDAVLDVNKVQAFVQTQYDLQVGVRVSTSCAPGKLVLVVKPRTVITCTVTDTQGTTDMVQVRVEDAAGNVSIAMI